MDPAKLAQLVDRLSPAQKGRLLLLAVGGRDPEANLGLYVAYHVEGRSQSELATRHGCCQVTVSQRLARTRRNLARLGIQPAPGRRLELAGNTA